METGTLYDQIVALWPATGGVPGWVVFATAALLVADLGLVMVLLFLHLGRSDPYAEYKMERSSNPPRTRTYRESQPSGNGPGWRDAHAGKRKEVQEKAKPAVGAFQRISSEWSDAFQGSHEEMKKQVRNVVETFQRVSNELKEGKDAASIEIFPPRPSRHDPYIEAARGLKVVENPDGSFSVENRRFSRRPDAEAYLDLVRRTAEFN